MALRGAPVILFALDSEGVFTEVAGGALDGASGRFVGRSASDVFGDHPQIVRNVQRVLAGERFTDTVALVRPGRLPRYFECAYVPVGSSLPDSFGSGSAGGAIGLALEVTTRGGLDAPTAAATPDPARADGAAPSPPTRVLVVDGCPLLRQGLRQALAETADLAPVAEVGTGEEALRIAREGEVDAVVLDIRLPDLDGIEVLTRLRAERPALPVLALSLHKEVLYALPLLEAGASGYLTKAESSARVVEAVRKIARGEPVIPEGVARLLLEERGCGEPSPSPTAGGAAALSPRELQVLRGLAEGRSVKEIAKRLCLSASTVRTYKRRLKRKLGLGSVAELARYAAEQGYVA